MRYNKHELFALASQTSQNFEREGVLILKERQDSFFRRSEGCSARWFRLRGNLLFYLKGPESWYEPLGLIVLGNHQVSVQTQDENGHWPFKIVWENGVCYRLATFLESERTQWLKAMQSAPYEQMTQRIVDLQWQLKDTRTLIELKNYRITNKIINDFNEVPLCEMSLSCDNLLCDSNGNAPTPFAAVFVLFPEKEVCVRYCSTEAVERCSNPTFCRTVMFRGSDGITSDALVRIAVYDIRETVTQTGVAMGSVTMRLNHIQEAQRLRVPLMTVDEKIVGFITISGWSLEPSHAGASPTHPNVERNAIDLTPKVICHRRSQSLPPRLGLKLKYPSYNLMIRQNFLNPHQATYRFHSGLGGEITVHEAIAEPRFCYTMPLQLVEIYMNREKELLEAMLAFADVTKRVAPRHLDLVSSHLSVMKLLQAAKKAQDLFNTHLNVMKIYQNSKRMMLKYAHTFFKPSARKEEADLEFVPTNLHLQRMWVHNDTLNKTGFHDIVTAGAFSAHSHQTDKPGGLIRLVQQSKDTSTKKAELMANTTRLEAEFEKLHAMRALRNVAIANMDRTLLLVQASRFEDAKRVVEDIKYNVSTILGLWNVVAVEEALSRIGWDKKRIDEESEVIRLAEQQAIQAQQAAAPQGVAGASAPEGAAGASIVEGVAALSIKEGAAGSSTLEGAAGLFTLEGEAGPSTPESIASSYALESQVDPSTAEGVVGPEGAAVASASGGVVGPSAPERVVGISAPEDAAGACAIEGVAGPSAPEVVTGFAAPYDVAGTSAPVTAAGSSIPEGGVGIYGSFGTFVVPQVPSSSGSGIPNAATASFTQRKGGPRMSPALKSAIIASAAEGAMNVLSEIAEENFSYTQVPLALPAPSSSSSSDNTPTADTASASGMQQNNELLFRPDHFKKESESSENSGTSAQSDQSGTSKSSAKNARNGKKPTRKGKYNRNVQNRIADSDKSERPNRPGRAGAAPPALKPKPAAAPPPLQLEQRRDNPKTGNKSSTSSEQVPKKKVEKKKGKKNWRAEEVTPESQFVMDPVVRQYNFAFFSDVTAAIKDMVHNMELSIHEIAKKGSYTETEIEDSKILMDLLVKLLDETHKWTRMAHTAMRIDSETPMWTLEHASLQSRRDTCFSQALTTTAAGLMCWLSSESSDVIVKIIQSGLGPLCGFEGLLSLYALERTMWGDMVVAIEDLHTVIFKLVKLTSSIPVIPQVTGRRNAIIVELPVCESLYARFHQYQDKPSFTVTAVFFNIGINEKAVVAEALGESRAQYPSNCDNLDKLNKYYHNYTKVFPNDPLEPIRASSRSKPLEEVMENLSAAVAKRASKDTDVIQLASLATRLMHGMRFTSCKSAKDRTGMSVTLEQTNILSTEYHLADMDRKRSLDVMRSEGCRRENALKNIGLSKYAFSKKQVMSLPEEYQPPRGSYGTQLT